MNLKKLEEIISSPFPDELKERMIIDCLAKDEKVIPTIMKILDAERYSKNELLIDMNLELSRADSYLRMSPEHKKELESSFNIEFIRSKIAEFYIKYKSMVRHCFERTND